MPRTKTPIRQPAPYEYRLAQRAVSGFDAFDPLMDLEQVTDHWVEIGSAVGRLAKECGWLISVDGNQYLSFKAWQAIGQLFGVITCVTSTKQEDSGHIAYASLIQLASGREVGGALGLCNTSEPFSIGNHIGVDCYTRRIAQMRATAFAYRMSFCHIASWTGFPTDPMLEDCTPFEPSWAWDASVGFEGYLTSFTDVLAQIVRHYELWDWQWALLVRGLNLYLSRLVPGGDSLLEEDVTMMASNLDRLISNVEGLAISKKGRLNPWLLDEAINSARRLRGALGGDGSRKTRNENWVERQRTVDGNLVGVLYQHSGLKLHGRQHPEGSNTEEDDAELFLLLVDLLAACPDDALEKEHWLRSAIKRERARRRTRREADQRAEKNQFLPYKEPEGRLEESDGPSAIGSDFRQWLASASRDDIIRLVDDWKEIGREAGLTESDSRLLQSRARGESTRGRENTAAYKRMRRAASKLRKAIEEKTRLIGSRRNSPSQTLTFERLDSGHRVPVHIENLDLRFARSREGTVPRFAGGERRTP